MSQMTIQQALELALRHHNARELQQAESIYRQILQADPNNEQALRLLGVLADQIGRQDVAIEMIGRAIQLRPDDAVFQNDFGKALASAGREDDALRAFTRALEIDPKLPAALNNIALVQKNRGELEASVGNLRRALELEPESAEVHWNLAQALLLDGNFREGWSEYEWRWRLAMPPSVPRSFSQPLWDGSDLQGRTILLHAEQGFGDAIQFARYVPMVVSRGGRVILEAPAALVPLFRSIVGVEQFVAWGEAIPAFDVHAPLLTLPKNFGTTLETIPAEVPYLAAPEDRLNYWRERLGSRRGKPRVGICWAGRATHALDRDRSIPLKDFSPLSGAVEATFFSLQKGSPVTDAPMPLLDFTQELTDFGETAALIEQMDVIVTVDTAVAHLAGALAKKVYTLLPFAPDWRWMLNRDESPWYPTMRLFRQPSRSGWETIIQQLAETLAREVI